MAFTQEDVNNWFAANPNANTAQVAQTVQGLGGLSANPELTGMLAQHYGATDTGVTNAYNTLTNTTPAGPSSVADLYSSVLGRAPDASGLAYWQQQFGNTIDPSEVAAFKNAAAPELAKTGYVAPTPVTPNYTDPAGIANLYQTYLGRTPESQAVINEWTNAFGPTIDPSEVALFRKAAAPELTQTHYLSDPFKGEIKDYVSNVLADKTLTPWEQTNKIMEQAQKSGVTQSQLESIYGKEAVTPYMDTYKRGINDFLTETLAKEPGTTPNEVGAIHKAAQKYGLTPDEIAKYGNLDSKQVQSYFDQYDQGLGNIVAQLNDPKVNDVSKTAAALTLARDWGTTDAELAKASKGKWTEKDVKDYLDPVRNVPTNLQKLFDDPNATAADIQKFVTDAKKDPRAAGIYGTTLDKLVNNNPDLYLRDATNGTNPADSLRQFLTTAKSTPELATKYAPKIAAVEKMFNIAQYNADEFYGGKVQDYQVQLMSKLNPAKVDAPKALDITPPKYETRVGLDEAGQPYEYKALVSNAKVHNANVYATGDDDGKTTGYESSKPVNVNGVPVYVQYDENGKVSGYVGKSDTRVFYPGGNSGSFSGKWDAQGNPITQYHPPGRSGGFVGGFVQDLAGAGTLGMLALAAATGGLGSLAAGALEGALGSTLANAAGAGLVGGTLSDLAGGNFAKGFVGGGLGNLAGNMVGSSLPTDMTSSPIVNEYLTKALPNLASAETRALVNGQNLGNAGVASLLGTGTTMGTNALINAAMPNTLTPTQQQWAGGIGGNLLTSAITGKPVNVQNAILNTTLQNAMNAGKQAVKG